jgi:hypothetical protein
MMASMNRTRRVQVFLVLVVTMSAQAAAGHVFPSRHIHRGRKTVDSKIIAKTRGPVALKPEGVSVALEPPASGPRRISLAAQVGKLRNNRRLYLVIRDLHAEHPPESIYHVYLNLPRDKKIGEDRTDSVGSINFYASQSGASRSDFFFSYDVTETLKNLLAKKLLIEPLTVTIIPAGEPTVGSVPTVGQIQLIEQ